MNADEARLITNNCIIEAFGKLAHNVLVEIKKTAECGKNNIYWDYRDSDKIISVLQSLGYKVSYKCHQGTNEDLIFIEW